MNERCIHPQDGGYRVQIKRGGKFHYSKLFTGEHALERAIAARDAALKGAPRPGPVRSNTGHVGISESSMWRGQRSYPCFIITWYDRRSDGSSRMRCRRVYYGQRRTREQALKRAIHHRPRRARLQPTGRTIVLRMKKSKQTKMRARRAARAERTCVRCGCTESRACRGGCSWIFPETNVCDACVTLPEMQVVMALKMALDEAAPTWRPFYRAATSAFGRILSAQRSTKSKS